MIKLYMVFKDWGEENEKLKFFYYKATAEKFIQSRNKDKLDWSIEEIEVDCS